MTVILTVTGQNKFAAALGGGDPVTFTDFAVGDGGGDYYTLDENQTALVNETWRGDVNRVEVDITNLDQVIIETLIPAGVGGWTIREAGLFDAVGDLIAIALYPLTEKPAPGSGSEKEIYARIVLQTTNGGSAVIEISPDLTMATLQDLADHEAKQLDPADTDTVKEKHLSNAQANGWETGIAANAAAIAANYQAILDEASARSAADIESGTVMVFGQSSPPTGWTRKTDWQDNAMLCFAASGVIGNGGAANPQSAHSHTGPSHAHAMGSHTHAGPSHSHNMGSHYHAGPNHYHSTAAHTLSAAEMPVHSHNVELGGTTGSATTITPKTASPSGSVTSTTAGSGGSHSHGNTGYNGTGNTGGPSTNTTGAAGTGATGGPSTNTTGDSGTGSTGENAAPYYQEVIAATKD